MPHFRKSPSHGSQVTEAVSCLRLQRRTGSHHCHLHLHKHHHLHLNHQFLIIIVILIIMVIFIIIVIIIIVIIIIVTLSSSPSSSSSTDVCLDSGQPLHRVVYCGFLVRQSVIQNVTPKQIQHQRCHSQYYHYRIMFTSVHHSTHFLPG